MSSSSQSAIDSNSSGNPPTQAPLEVLRELAEVLARAREPQVVYHAAIAGLRDALGVHRASVLTFDEQGVARFRAWAGLSGGYRDAVDGHCPWTSGQRDAVPIPVEDVVTDERFADYRETFEREGIRALAFIPLMGSQGCLGKFMLYYSEPHRFTTEEMQLSAVIGTQVAYAAERVQAAEHSRKQSERLAWQAELLDLAHDAILAISLDGIIEFWNRGAETTYGFTAAEAVGQSAHQLLRTIFPEPLPALVSKCLTGRIWEGELIHTTRSGATRVVSSRWAVRENEHGEPAGILEINRDITDQKKQERRVNDILNSIRQSFIAVDREWRFIYVNDRVVERLGLPREQVLGRNMWEVAPGFRETSFYENYRRVLEERIPLSFEVVSPEGKFFWEVHAYPTEEGLSSYVLDATDRRNAEVAIRTSEERYRCLVEALSAVVWRADASGEFAEPQSGWQTFTGQAWEDQRGDGWMSALHPEDRTRIRAAWTSAVASACRCWVEGRLWNSATTSYRHVQLASVPILNAGAVREWIGTVTDVHEQRAIEERLRQAGKLESLGVLAGGIAHDFNNLLVGILGSAGLLQEEIPPGSDLRASVDIIAEASERASQLTQQMLAYSGRGHFVIEPLNVSREVEQVLTLVNASIPRHVRLCLNLPAGLPPVKADAGQLQQLVMNLVINAAEAISSEGAIQVTASVREIPAAWPTATGELAAGNYVAIEVRDSGAGMEPEVMARIFDPFFTTKFTGRGLGLAASMGIVRGHRGGIDVESVPGQGSLFTVYLPCAEGKPALRRRPAIQLLEGKGTILVIDDEDVVLKTARVALERRGYSVVTARNGKEGIEQFTATSQPSLVLLDMTMPVMGGDEALRRLRELDPEIRVIGSSGYTEKEAVRRFGTGLAGFLQKPYSVQQLYRAIQDALE